MSALDRFHCIFSAKFKKSKPFPQNFHSTTSAKKCLKTTKSQKLDLDTSNPYDQDFKHKIFRFVSAAKLKWKNPEISMSSSKQNVKKLDKLSLNGSISPSPLQNIFTTEGCHFHTFNVK